MAVIKFDNGKSVQFDGTPTPQDIEEVAKSFGGTSIPSTPPQKGILGKAWDALAVPEQKSREGLNIIAKSLPESYTGNTLRDTVVNTPRIAAETLADVAPGFISRGALLTSGALGAAKLAAPAIKAVGGAIGKGAEALSGLSYKTPGVLAEATADPTLIFGSGLDKARQLYEDAKTVTPAIRDEFKTIPDKTEFVQKVIDAANGGSVTPYEALEARKTLDTMKKNVPDIYYQTMRDKLDVVAKQAFQAADEAFQRAIKSEALRKIMPMNKTGTPSIGKMILGGFEAGAAPFMSPAAQGLTASAIGGASKLFSPAINNPALGAAGSAAIQRLFGNQ